MSSFHQFLKSKNADKLFDFWLLSQEYVGFSAKTSLTFLTRRQKGRKIFQELVKAQPATCEMLGGDIVSQIGSKLDTASLDLFDDAIKVVEEHLSAQYFPAFVVDFVEKYQPFSMDRQSSNTQHSILVESPEVIDIIVCLLSLYYDKSFGKEKTTTTITIHQI